MCTVTWQCGLPMKTNQDLMAIKTTSLGLVHHYSNSTLHISMESVLLVFCVALVMVSFVRSARFDELYQPSWAFDHFNYEMSSEGPNHNEFDFEFLGNTSGEAYLVQTNVYVNGVGNREQRLNLWFDPTKDFHAYSILWNRRQVVFLVDDTPIRVHTNLEHKGIPYPKDQAMGVYSSIWNADDWATQGGRVKTDWRHAPFVASYKGFLIDASECPTTMPIVDNAKRCSSSGEKRYWWDEPTMSELSLHQSHQLLWVKANHMVYDYCTDTARFPIIPAECQHRHS